MTCLNGDTYEFILGEKSELSPQLAADILVYVKRKRGAYRY